jgi:hypothetical protein
MEKFHSTHEVSFKPEDSPVHEAYSLLGARTPLELSNLYTDADQYLMVSDTWDYDNPDLIVNKIKTILETVDLELLPDGESEWCREILWFWYHHAISCAVVKYKDMESAKEYSSKALGFQSEDHPNKITKLLFFLVHQRMDDAKEWATQIDEEPEKTTAADLILAFQE